MLCPLVLPDGGKLIAETRGDIDLPDNAVIMVHFDIEDALFFDGQTERRLR